MSSFLREVNPNPEIPKPCEGLHRRNPKSSEALLGELSI
jgi:hypothetical protein